MARFLTVIMFVVAFHSNFACGAITPYYDKQTWMDAVGSHTTITFQEFPVGTWVSDQYADLGITFDLNASFYSQIQADLFFSNDRVGLRSFGLSGWPVVRFTEPRYAIAVETLDSAPNFFLYYQGISIGNATVVSGGYFKGIVSTLPFDTVLAMPTAIDDLHFGPSVPAPSVFALFAVIMMGGTRRR